jgi:hypothetical protein
MTKAERELRELALTLFSTGRFESKRDAMKEAKATIARREEKLRQSQATETPITMAPEGADVWDTFY